MGYRSKIEALKATAETGEQWAEICRLEALAIEEERATDCNALVVSILQAAGFVEVPSDNPGQRVFTIASAL